MSVASPWTDYAAAVRFAMTRRRLTQKDIAAMAGVSRGTVSTWLARKYIPSPEVVARLAQGLDAPYLAEAATNERRRTCDLCGRTFEALNRRSVARFCSDGCRIRWWHVKRAEETHEARLDHLVLLRNMVEEMTVQRDRTAAALDDHCRACEPDGVCRDAACAIQAAGISPLPLARRGVA